MTVRDWRRWDVEYQQHLKITGLARRMVLFDALIAQAKRRDNWTEATYLEDQRDDVRMYRSELLREQVAWRQAHR